MAAAVLPSPDPQVWRALRLILGPRRRLETAGQLPQSTPAPRAPEKTEDWLL